MAYGPELAGVSSGALFTEVPRKCDLRPGASLLRTSVAHPNS